MSTAERDEDTFTRVFLWRRRTLREAGYDRRSADLLASQVDVDLHRAVSMLEAGCAPELVLKILL